MYSKQPVLRDLAVLAYLSGITVLGITYALRPFRYGLPLLILVSLGVWTYSQRKWEDVYTDDPIGHRTAERLVAGYLDEGPDRIDLEHLLGRAAHGRYPRLHLNLALLEAADSLDGADALHERIVMALGEIGHGQRAEEYLRNMIDQTDDDSSRSRLHDAAELAYQSVKSGDFPLPPSNIHHPIPPSFGRW